MSKRANTLLAIVVAAALILVAAKLYRSSKPFRGTVSQFTVFKYALTEDEVRHLATISCQIPIDCQDEAERFSDCKRSELSVENGRYWILVACGSAERRYFDEHGKLMLSANTGFWDISCNQNAYIRFGGEPAQKLDMPLWGNLALPVAVGDVPLRIAVLNNGTKKLHCRAVKKQKGL